MFVLVAALSATASPPTDDAGMRRLVEVTNQVCAQPDAYGYSAQGGIGADARAKVPKMLEKLFSVGLSASVKGQAEYHSGPAQKDVGASQVARLQCSQNVFLDLNRRYAITNRSTGQRVLAGRDPVKVFQRLSPQSATASSQPMVSNTGSGEQAVSVNQSGGINAVHIDTVTLKEDRHIYLTMLQDIYSQGQTILSGLESRRPTDETIQDDAKRTDQWVGDSVKRIQTMMTPAAAQSFLVIHRTAMFAIFNPPLNPAPTSDNMNIYNAVSNALPQYLANIQYLMDHDTMDPQNQGSKP